MVKKIEEYCKKYQEWPKYKKYAHAVSDGITSNQLASWLATSGYSKGKFKYTDVVDENGRLVKEILDELYTEYKLKKKEEYDKAKEEFNQTSKFNEVIEKRNSNAKGIS